MRQGYKKPSHYNYKKNIENIPKFAYFQTTKLKILENFECHDETIFRTILIREKIIRYV